MTCIQQSTPVLKKTLDLNYGMIGEEKVDEHKKNTIDM